MVLPLMELNPILLGTPTEEVLRLRPFLKGCLIGLGCVIVIEIIAARIFPALTDGITVVMGALLFRRDFQGMIQGLQPFVVIASLNLFFQALNLIELLTGAPGYQHFFSDTCVFPPGTLIRNGKKVMETVDLCSWQTVLGNVALLLALPLEFFCVRYAYRMHKSMRQATEGIASAMMDLEAAQLASARTAQFLQPSGAMAAAAGLAGAPASGAPRAGPQSQQQAQLPTLGFTPYSGQPHKLGD